MNGYNLFFMSNNYATGELTKIAIALSSYNPSSLQMDTYGSY